LSWGWWCARTIGGSGVVGADATDGNGCCGEDCTTTTVGGGGGRGVGGGRENDI